MVYACKSSPFWRAVLSGRLISYGWRAHPDGVDRAFGSAETATDASFVFLQEWMGVKLPARDRFGRGQAVDRTGLDADAAGHACFQVKLRFFPGRAFDPFASNSKRILDRRCRAYPSTDPALDAKQRIDQVEVFLLSRNGAYGTEFNTGPATVACFRNSIGHTITSL